MIRQETCPRCKALLTEENAATLFGRDYCVCKACLPICETIELRISHIIHLARIGYIPTDTLLWKADFAIENATPDFKKVLLALNDYTRISGNVAIVGPNGTGKTTITKVLLRRALMHGVESRFVRTSQIHDAMFNGGDEISELGEVELLVIDDIDKGVRNEVSLQGLLEVLNLRREHARPTVITSNVEIESLPELWSEYAKNPSYPSAILDRLRPLKIYFLGGASLRGEVHRFDPDPDESLGAP